MDPGHVLSLGVGVLHYRDNFIEGHGRGVHHQGVFRRMGDHRLRHQRSGVEHHRRRRDQIPRPDGEQVGGARPGADEVHRHPEASWALSSRPP